MEKNNEHPEHWAEEICINTFDEKSAAQFRLQVKAVTEHNPDQPIIIYIDSYGGYVDSLAKMLETMNEAPNRFITVCMGKAVSCGAILLSHGDVRYCGELSRIMIHNVSSSSWGDVYSLKAQSDETMRMNKRFMTLLAENCGISYNLLQDRIKEAVDSREIWLNAKEAKEFGIVDELGTPLLKHTSSWECLSIRKDPKKEFIIKKKTSKKKKKTISKRK